jgi:hypothetical protein
MMIIAWMAAGICSTLAMDVFGGIVRKTGFTTGAPPQLIARLFWTVFRGQFRVDKEAVTPLTPGRDRRSAFGPLRDRHDTRGRFWILLSAIRCADASVVGIDRVRGRNAASSWLWMFPAFGFGVFGLNGPAELLLFRTALVNHVLFGVGLALAVRFGVPRFG